MVPQLVDASRTPYEIIGAGYALLSVLVFIGGALRYRMVKKQLERGGYVEVQPLWIAGLTLSAALLALGTLAVIVFQD